MSKTAKEVVGFTVFTVVTCVVLAAVSGQLGDLWKILLGVMLAVGWALGAVVLIHWWVER